jgi:hypothetical protein
MNEYPLLHTVSKTILTLLNLHWNSNKQLLIYVDESVAPIKEVGHTKFKTIE